MSTSMNQQVPLASMPAQEKTLGTVGQNKWQQNNWQQEQLTKNTYDSDLNKREYVYQSVLPQGQQATSLPAETIKQTLPVSTQGFTQGSLVVGEQPVMLNEKTLQSTQGSWQQGQGVVQQQQLGSSGVVQQQQYGSTGVAQEQQFGATSGVIPLKPICIEQEAVSFRPQAITIEQPPLMVQPETITIPQPPIVIHPEPIVIPQAPLVFQPPAVALARQALTFQPEEITLARPSYTVQPLIQYDMRGCARFDEQDFKQHTHIRLTNDQIMRQQYGENWNKSGQFASTTTTLSNNNVQLQKDSNFNSNSNFNTSNSNYSSSNSNSNLQSSQSPSTTGSGNVTKPAKFFSRDRNYDYGLPASTGDKIKDAFGVANNGPQNPELLNNVQNQKSMDSNNTY